MDIGIPYWHGTFDASQVIDRRKMAELICATINSDDAKTATIVANNMVSVDICGDDQTPPYRELYNPLTENCGGWIKFVVDAKKVPGITTKLEMLPCHWFCIRMPVVNEGDVEVTVQVDSLLTGAVLGQAVLPPQTAFEFSGYDPASGLSYQHYPMAVNPKVELSMGYFLRAAERLEARLARALHQNVLASILRRQYNVPPVLVDGTVFEIAQYGDYTVWVNSTTDEYDMSMRLSYPLSKLNDALSKLRSSKYLRLWSQCVYSTNDGIVKFDITVADVQSATAVNEGIFAESDDATISFAKMFKDMKIRNLRDLS